MCVVGVATVVGVLVALSLPGVKLSDRLAAAGDILASAMLLLTVFAGLVALRAYAVSTGLPDLKLQVLFEFSEFNNPVFECKSGPGMDRFSVIAPFKQTASTISIRNDSRYSARNPAVTRVGPRIRPDGCGGAVTWGF